MTKRILPLFACPLLVVFAMGCAPRNQQALTASSAESPGYAARYPDALAAKRDQLSVQQEQARQQMGEIKAYPGELESPAWEGTLELVDQAEADGKSEAYASHYEQSAQVAQFYEEESKTIRNRVAGSVQYAAKQNDCKEGGKLGGAAVHALDKAVEKQQKERLRARGEAHRTLERQKGAYGKKQSELLADQLDGIAKTSYLVNVGVESSRRDLEARVAEASTAKSTLDSEIADLEVVIKDESTSDADKKVAEQLLDEAKVAQGKLDSEVEQAEHAAEEVKQSVEALKKEFSEVMQALRDELKKRAEAEEGASKEPAEDKPGEKK